MDEGLAWKGAGLGALEWELYERTREATEEAQRQGAAQLKAAVEAGGAVKPLDFNSLSNRWSFGFKESGLEGAYRIKSISFSCFNKIVSIPVACELAACTLYLFRMKMITDLPSSLVHFLGYICVVVCCITILSSQMLFSKWYQGCRGIIVQYMTTMLWIWESIQIFLMADHEWTYISYHALALSTCTSVLYQVPFYMHLRLRIFGLACQAAAILARGKRQDSLTLLFVITVSHLLGVLLSYVLERRARLCFLKSMPCWQAEDVTVAPLQSQFSEPFHDSLFNQYCNILCSQSIERTSSKLSTVMITPRDRSAPHRALGGFAGGFAGVSGLKCKFPLPTTSLFSSSDSLSEHGRMSDSESDEDVNSSTSVSELRLRDTHSEVEGRWMQETITDSAYSQIKSSCTSSQKQQLGGQN